MTALNDLVSRFRKPEPAPPDENAILIAEIREVRRQLAGLQSCFAMESDEDLLDAAIYQREALQARHRYLLRRARETRAAAEDLPILMDEQIRIN